MTKRRVLTALAVAGVMVFAKIILVVVLAGALVTLLVRRRHPRGRGRVIEILAAAFAGAVVDHLAYRREARMARGDASEPQLASLAAKRQERERREIERGFPTW